MTNAQQIEAFLDLGKALLKTVKDPTASTTELTRQLSRAANVIKRPTRK